MMVTQKIGKTSSALSILLLGNCLQSNSTFAFEESYKNHSFSFGARSRVAKVQVENGENARAASQLLRITINSDWNSQFSSLIELDYVALKLKDEFSNGVRFNGKPVIPDVEGADLNQIFLSYSPTNQLEIKIGREAINLVNERFVGTNGFWQNEQTLDNIGVKFKFSSASYLTYRYVDNANRINGGKAGKFLKPSDVNFKALNGRRPAPFLGDHDHDTHLLYGEFNEWDFSKLQAYYFDMHISDAKPLSNKTIGLRHEYKKRLSLLRVQSHAELAVQERPTVSDKSRMIYHNFSAGFGFGPHELTLKNERLGERDGVSFVTPLASLHDQNGWADQFLITPSVGLIDTSLQYIWRKKPWKLDTRYHYFQSDDTKALLGQEVDIDLAYKFNRRHRLLFRYTNFYSDGLKYKDQQRLFLMYHYNI